MDSMLIAKFFEKNMIKMVLVSITAGILLGVLAPIRAQELKVFINFTIFLMIYPMMVGISMVEILQSSKQAKPIGLAILLNFFISPLVGTAIAYLVLQSYPNFAVALILLSVTPCAGMVVGWTGLARGNVPLAMVIVALSLVLSIVTIPISMNILAGSVVSIDTVAMVRKTMVIILLPLFVGQVTRKILFAKLGTEIFNKHVKPLLAPVSMSGMFIIIFISTAMGADRILSEIHTLLYIIPALLLFYFVQFNLATISSRFLGLNVNDTTAVTFGVSGKNISLAIGIAVQFFSPLTVVMLAINPLIQMPSMAFYMRRVISKKEKAVAYKKAP